MLSNKLAFAAVAISCIGAAGAGGYLASRQNAVPTPAAAQSAPTSAVEAPQNAPASSVAARPAAPQPVQETEGVVGDAPVPRAAAAKNAPAKRAEAAPVRTPESRQARASSARQDHPPPLPSTWPAGAASQPQLPVPPPQTTDPQPPHVDEKPAPDLPRAPEPPQQTVEELVVSARIGASGCRRKPRLSSETARVEDRVDARVTRDVRVGDRVAIPAGSRAIGSVMQVERGGKFKERARLGIRFHTLVLADGTRVPISHRNDLSRRRCAGQRQRGQGGRRRGRRRDPRRDSRRRQGRGDRRDRRRRRRRGRRHGRRPQRRHIARGHPDDRPHPLAGHRDDRTGLE